MPHARIVHVDTSRAERLVGVRAVVTGRDAPYTHNAAIIKDWPFLAQDKVRHIGEAVAAVAAVDEETAEEALALIDVEYEELPAVFDPEAAMQPGAPLLHEGLAEYPRAEAFHPVAGTNICNHYRLRRGDAEAALADCAVVVEERYSTLLKHTHAPAGFLPDLLARVQVRYPEIPIVFLETRPLAEEWTYRWLGAALAELEDESGLGLTTP